NLGGLRLSNSGLVRLRRLTHLRELDLSRTQVTADGFDVLRQLPQLRTLKLWKMTAIGDGSIPQLTALRNLTLVDVSETRLTEGGVTQIRNSLPGCKVLW